MTKCYFHYIVFPKFTSIKHFILGSNCLILSVFASLLMFRNFLDSSPISHEHLLFLLSRTASLFFCDKFCQSPSDPSRWGLTVIELCPHGHDDWSMVEYMTHTGPIIVLPWELFFYLGEGGRVKRARSLERRGVFLSLLVELLTRLGTQGYQRPFSTP